ncbi:MAG TPA: globin domain-containing protein [Polyangiales bacterium]|jgi:hemoglobin-like flavoprotein|nr:globin domain-containing protein [Polyangiales bacterium]
MITDSEKDEIRRTWKLVVPIGSTAADLFYKRLFELRPEYAALFTSDLAAQKRKLVQMLAFIVKSLDWPESAWKDAVSAEEDLVLVVLALGRRHKDLYRIPEESYAVVGEALLWTLDYGLGPAFDDSARAAWLHVYQLVSTTMRMGAAMTNGNAALEAREQSEELGEAALEDFQRKFGHEEIKATGSSSRGETV